MPARPLPPCQAPFRSVSYIKTFTRGVDLRRLKRAAKQREKCTRVREKKKHAKSCSNPACLPRAPSAMQPLQRTVINRGDVAGEKWTKV